MTLSCEQMAELAADAFAVVRKWGAFEQRSVHVVGTFNYWQLAYPMLDDYSLVGAWDVHVSVEGVTRRVIVGQDTRGHYGVLAWEQLP